MQTVLRRAPVWRRSTAAIVLAEQRAEVGATYSDSARWRLEADSVMVALSDQAGYRAQAAVDQADSDIVLLRMIRVVHVAFNDDLRKWAHDHLTVIDKFHTGVRIRFGDQRVTLRYR